MEPLVSISCLTYNHAPYIKNALDGFLMQKTDFPFEVVVHDDASTDGTQDILREYETAYPEIFNIIYQKENQYGKTKSFVDIERKFMEPRIRGKYVAACEGDDYWFCPDKLQMQINYMEKHPDCSLCFHPVIWLDETEESRVFKIDQSLKVEKDYYANDIISPNDISVPTCSRVMRADMGSEWPKFREIADIGDLPGKFLLASKGYFHYFPKTMGVYRWGHPGSWNASRYNDTALIVNNAICTLKWLFEFNRYSERKYEVALGHKMLSYIVVRLDILDAVGNYPWLVNIVTQAHGKKDKMLNLEKLAKKSGSKASMEKYKAAEKEYWSWFVQAVGDGIKNEN